MNVRRTLLPDIPTRRLRWCAGAAAAIFFLLAAAAWQHGFPDGKEAGHAAGAWRSTARTAVPAALLISGLLGTLAAVAARPLMATQPVAVPVPGERPSAAPRRVTAVLLAGIMLLGGALTFPRMHQSLWLDEEFSMRHFIVGDFTPKSASEQWPGPLRWNPVTLSETLWDYRTPNNHGLFSVLARFAHGGVKHPSRPDALHFVPWRLRLPAAAAALLSLPLVWLLMRRMGFGPAALGAPLLMSLHPWFVRYAGEARGYGLLYLLWPVTCLLLLEALRDGRWRWWLALGLAMALLAWAWLNEVYWLACLHAPVLLAARRLQGTQRRSLAIRWAASCLLAAVIFLPLALPGLLQSLAWVKLGRAQSSPEALGAVVADVASSLLSGAPWFSPDDTNPLCHGRVMDIARPWFLAAALALPVALTLTGAWAWRGRAGFLLVLALPLPLLFGHALARGSIVMNWYGAPVLPAFCMVAAAGAEQLANRCRLQGGKAVFAVLALTAASGMAGLGEVRTLLRHEIEPNLAALRLTTSTTNPWHADHGKDSLTAGCVQMRRGYDPRMVSVKEPAELHAQLRAASSLGVPMFFHIGDIRFARLRHPDLMKIIEDPAWFIHVATLHGLDHAQTRHIWRWSGRLPTMDGSPEP